MQEKLEEERQKNVLLEKQLQEAKSEIADVKKRNTMLLSMLSQGESKRETFEYIELYVVTEIMIYLLYDIFIILY